MQTIVTHSGSFDPDDVLAVATLQLLLGVENTEVIRSRARSDIEAGDFVVDVGREYDPEQQRFDHHQLGAPVRDNGVPYSAFGLVWKEYGLEIAGSEQVAAVVEQRLVEPIDAADNHQRVCHPSAAGVGAFELYDVIDVMRPVWGSNETYDEQFAIALTFARNLLERLIRRVEADQVTESLVKKHYEGSANKSVLVFEEHIPRHVVVPFPGVQVIVCPVPSEEVKQWSAAVIPVHQKTFQNRALFPERWAGLVDAELQLESGIADAIFCHRERYIFVAGTKESAIKAAHHALF